MKILIVAATLMAFAPAAASATILVNGDFQAASITTGWTVSGDVNLGSGPIYNPCCGVTGGVPGNLFAAFGGGNVTSTNAISQSFATVLGKAYTVSFQYGALGGGSQAITFKLTGLSDTVLTPTANNDLNTTFATYTTSFVGSGSPATIEFSNASFADGIDPIVDNVSVVAVPEPASWALMVIGFGMIGFAMRRRIAVSA